MKWLFFPFYRLKRARAADAVFRCEAPYSSPEESVSRPPLADLARRFGRVAQQEAADLKCSRDQAWLIVMKRLQWQ